MHNSQNTQNQFTSGRWTDQEQALFVHGLMYFGKDWKRFESIIKTRNSSQIRSHAQKFFLKINHIKKLQKKIKYKQKSYFSVFSQDETKLLQMIKTEKVTNKTPQDILSLLQLDSPRKQLVVQDDQIQNDNSLHLSSQKSRKNSIILAQSHLFSQSILGIPIGSMEQFNQSINKLKQMQNSNQSFLSILIVNNLFRMMKASSILQLVDFSKIKNEQKMVQQEMQDQVNQLSEVLKKSQCQHLKSPDETKMKQKVGDQLSQPQISFLGIHEK